MPLSSWRLAVARHLHPSSRAGRRRDSRGLRFRPQLECLEERTTPAPLTGGTGPGGFILTNGSSNLTLWYDATAVNTVQISGGLVTGWLDRSGYGNNATQPNVARQGTFNATALNGQPAIHLAAGQQLLPPNSFQVNLPYSVYVVDQYDGPNHGRTVDSLDTNWLIGKWSGQNVHYDNGWVSLGNNVDGLNNATNNVPVIGLGTNDVAANTAHYYRDSLDVSTSNAPNSNAGRIEIGGGYAGSFSEPSDFDISELIVFNRVLNSAERIIIDNYLSAEFGIAINATTGDDHYAGKLAANGTYSTDVFGIGEVDAADQVTTAGNDGFGIESTTLTPGQFVMAGNNVAVNSLVASNLPASESQRWNRSWYVDTTGGVAATLTFDLNDGGGLAGSANGYHLLYSATDPASGGTFSALNLTGTVNGSKISFTVPAALLQKGYFTLGYDRPPPPPPPLPPPQSKAIIVVGTDVGGLPEVKVFDARTMALKFDFFAYNPYFSGGVRVAAGDVNGDGVPDIITGPGPGGAPEVKVFNGVTGKLMRDFFAFPSAVTTGIYVASGDLNGDKFDDIVVGLDAGASPEVKAFSGKTGAVLFDFFAYNPFFTGGVRVAVGDTNGDGFADIITGPGPGALPEVKVFSGVGGAVMQDYFASLPLSLHGIYVGAYVSGGVASVIVGTGAGDLPLLSERNDTFYAYLYPYTDGVHVGSFGGGATSGPGEFLTSGGGVPLLNGLQAPSLPGLTPFQGPVGVQILDGLTLTTLDLFFAYPFYLGGVFVAGSH